ncbi:MAG: M15 family metallopeptidase [Candidatus Gracilibacteria bacterium]|nr:M15 family metallopeptidase [Candidatus Gracilibacteria bacterium]
MSSIESQNPDKVEKIRKRNEKKQELQRLISDDNKDVKNQSVIDNSILKQELLKDSFKAGIILESSITNPRILDKFKKGRLFENIGSNEKDSEFIVDFGSNKSAEYNIGLADLVDKGVETIEITGERHGRQYRHIGIRQGIKGSFFDEQTNRYIPVFSGDKVRVINRISQKELEKKEEENKNREIEIKSSPDAQKFLSDNNHSKEEFDLITKISIEYGIDPCLVMALRTQENGGDLKEFGVLKDDLNTYGSQLIFACRIIQKNMNKYKKLGNEPMNGNRFDKKFICFLSNIYAPIGASNDPDNLNSNHMSGVLKLYSKYSGENLGDIDSFVKNESKTLIQDWESKMNEGNNIGKFSDAEFSKILCGSENISKELMKPQMVEVDFLGRKVEVHKFIATRLLQAQDEILRDPEASQYFIKSVGGYNFRNAKKPGGGEYDSLSKHAYGLAIDINPGENPYLSGNSDDSKYMKCAIPRSFVDIMKNNGFNWGGDWKNSYDAMHFEFSNLEELKKEKEFYERKS